MSTSIGFQSITVWCARAKIGLSQSKDQRQLDKSPSSISSIDRQLHSPAVYRTMTSRDAYKCVCLRSSVPRLRQADSMQYPAKIASLNRSIHKISTRQLSTESVVSSSNEPPIARTDSILGERKPYKKRDYNFRTLAGIVLCRSPIITRELSDFEKAFYAYQRHLKSRLSSPFPTDFYFQKGSLASKRWLAAEDDRRQSNELVSSAPPTKTEQDGQISGEERELQAEEDVASTVSMSRITEADRNEDTKSLNRKLDRTLYLLLKKPRQEHAWQFPQGPIGAGEVLHESTSRILSTLAGRNMNTWTVGQVPVGHISYQFAEPDMGYHGNKVYFLRSRIFAGQCKLQEQSGIENFGWFTREEIEQKVDPAFWKSISSMLASQ